MLQDCRVIMRVIKKEILLLKSSTDCLEHANDDPYLAILQNSKFSVKSVPVLDFSFTELQVFRRKLLNPAKYSGIIFTSPRAVTAARLSLDSTDLPIGWMNLPAFVVGEGTAKMLQQELGLKGEGSFTGNGSNLAEFILQSTFKHPLLFPCGKLKQDILPLKLKEGGIALDIVIVYESCPHPDIAKNLQTVTCKGDTISEFVVYFSPSGVKFTLPILKLLNIPFDDIKIIAIGPTTKACLEESSLKVWSSALKPSPACLLEAVCMVEMPIP